MSGQVGEGSRVPIPVKSLDLTLQVAESARGLKRGENRPRLALRRKHREKGRLERRETS